MTLPVVAMSLLLLVPPAAAPDDAKDDRDKFQGTWKAVALEHEGRKAEPDEVKKFEFIVEGPRYVLRGGEEKFEGKLTLDPKASPHALDATFVDPSGNELGRVKGIYKFDGPRLVLCWSQGGGDRPEEFVTKPDSKRRMIVLEKK